MPIMPAISSGARMTGLVMYLAGPGKANEHTNPHVVAASSRDVFAAGGAGATMTDANAYDVASTVDEARVVFGTEVTRRDTKKLKAAMERGEAGRAAIADATKDENVWHCSLSMPPDVDALDDATWSQIAHDFMTGMGFDTDSDASARWVAIRHGLTKNGGDHIHIAASRVRDDGSVVSLWRPHPDNSKRNEGDYARAQRVTRDIETRYGLEGLSTYSKNMASRGRAHAQDAATKPTVAGAGRQTRPPRAEEAPSVALARRVRTAAASAETEAEFVRMLRADGLVVRSARYDKSDADAVTGFSVGLPASEYANRHGQPIMHGGKKLGEDLSLPRLRERWIDDDNTRRDARAAWDHADAASPAGRPSTARPRPAPPTTAPSSAQSEQRPTGDAQQRPAQASERLREILIPIARAASTEADYARALRDHPDVLARPRYAKGSTTEVTGYVVALRPELLADEHGKPIWRNASYLGDGLKLSELRGNWPTSEAHTRLAASAWARGHRSATAAGGTTQRADEAREHARRWHDTTSRIDPNSRAWHATAADTAAMAGAAAQRTTGADAASLRQLSDALGGVAGYRRSPSGAGAHKYTSARRVAAVMLAASREDTTLLWLTVMKQVLAASKAIADAMAAQGHHRHATTIRAAVAHTQHTFADRPAPTAVPGAGSARRAQGQSPSTPAARASVNERRGDDSSYER